MAGYRNDSYRASGVTLIVMGLLYLFDRLIGFSKLGLPWVMRADNLILYAAVIFLLLKKDKTVGVILAGIWLLLNINFIISLFGSISTYILPIVLLLLGILLYYKSK